MKCFKYGLILLAIVTLCGCGPMYSTNYNFVAPKSSTGIMCVSNCESSRNNCRMMQDMQVQSCNERSDYEYQICLSHAKDRKDCVQRYCSSADYSMCDSQYRSCYQGCGGQVIEQQVCVAFCK